MPMLLHEGGDLLENVVQDFVTFYIKRVSRPGDLDILFVLLSAQV